MKLLRILLSLALAVGALGLIGSFVVERNYASRAALMQRAEVDEAAAQLFGDPPNKIGKPAMMIVEDPKAFLEGEGDQRARLLNDKYLRENGIYPLQLQTVQYIAGLSRLGFGAALAVGLLGLLFLRRRR